MKNCCAILLLLTQFCQPASLYEELIQDLPYAHVKKPELFDALELQLKYHLTEISDIDKQDLKINLLKLRDHFQLQRDQGKAAARVGAQKQLPLVLLPSLVLSAVAIINIVQY